MVRVDTETNEGALNFGEAAIRLTLDDAALAKRAFDRLFLAPAAAAAVIGDVRYLRDDAVADIVHGEGPANAVVIERSVQGPRRFVLNLKVFNEFSVSVRREGNSIWVRYPGGAPHTYLLDDVLQAAIQPLLEELGGFILHGSCMVKNGVALALMGSSGAGKSTTAFNLMRAGYQCYADDAVVVTRLGNRLRAWPFSREISVRPLSFQLLETHGIPFTGYRQEGRKYYFKQPAVPAGSGAWLRHACLIEVGGERDTRIQRLPRDAFLEQLRGEQRYFSFVNRDRHEHYAEIVAGLVPEAASVQLGSDLAGQIEAFDSLLDPQERAPARSARPGLNGRSVKLALLRRAWLRPGAEPLPDLIPLLADSDLTIYKNALSFFQNFPLAQLVPAPEDDLPDAQGALDVDGDPIAWLRLTEWQVGGERLVRASAPETYEQYAAGWFRSAPMLYAILRRLVDSQSRAGRSLGEAWLRTRAATSAPTGHLVILLHGVPAEGRADPAGPAVRKPDRTLLSDGDAGVWDAAFARLAASGAGRKLILAPAFAFPRADFAATRQCLERARAHGLEPRLARCVPLCWLAPQEAAEILEHGGFLAPGEAPEPAGIVGREAEAFAVPLGERLSWERPECAGRSACRLHGLGLCPEGYLRWNGREARLDEASNARGITA